MTTTQLQGEELSNVLREAIVDQLRSCKTSEEMLSFETWFNRESSVGPLYKVICDFLKSRSISRAVAAKWLYTIVNDRETKISQ